MALPRARIVTLSAFQSRQMLPVAIHRGDILDFSVDFVGLLRSGETPAEVLSAANAAGRGVAVTNVAFSGTRVNLTISGAQRTGEALIAIAVSTNRGRTLSRSLRARTVWEEAVIAPFIPPIPPDDPCVSVHSVTPGTDEAGAFVQVGFDAGNVGSVNLLDFIRPSMEGDEIVGEVAQLRAFTSPEEGAYNLFNLTVHAAGGGQVLSSPPDVFVVEKDVTFSAADAEFGFYGNIGLFWPLPDGETPETFFDRPLTFEITICDVEYTEI